MSNKTSFFKPTVSLSDFAKEANDKHLTYGGLITEKSSHFISDVKYKHIDRPYAYPYKSYEGRNVELEHKIAQKLRYC